MIGFIGIFLCIMILQISPIRGEIFEIDDKTADLEYHNNSTEGNPGAGVHDEIDIESLRIDGEEIAVTFVAPPIVDDAIFYLIRIYWIGDDFLGNWTKGYLDNETNTVNTFIEDSTGTEITDTTEYDKITIVGSSLIIPLYNISLITSSRLCNGYLSLSRIYFLDYNERIIPNYNDWFSIEQEEKLAF